MHGKVGSGRAGMARTGEVSCGYVGSVVARQGLAGKVRRDAVCFGELRRVMSRLVTART